MLREADTTDAMHQMDIRFAGQETIESALAALDERSGALIAAIQQAIDSHDRQGDGVWLSGEPQPALEALLEADGISAPLRRRLAIWMSRRLEIDRETVQTWSSLDPAIYHHRLVPLRRILGWIEDETQRAAAGTRLIAHAVEHGGVGILKDAPGEPLAILYSGSMARYAREGLIELFAAPDTARPVVLISTSAVEVGVDFAADTLVTEECEGSSFLQRLGRVGRRQGTNARAWVLVEPKTLETLREALAGAREIGRERLSELVREHFPQRRFLGVSRYADALHVLVSQQLGRTGVRAADEQPLQARTLAREIVEAGVELQYGLRGTMPGMSLLDDGVSKDPFYILGYVQDKDVLPAATPFEVAAVRRSFNSLVFVKGWRKIFVRLSESLERCQAIAVPGAGGARIIGKAPGDTGMGIAAYYVEACAFISKLDIGLSALREGMLAMKYPLLAGGGCNAPHLLLAYGPICLGSAEYEGLNPPDNVRDANGSAVVLPEQWYLVIRPAATLEEGWAYLDRTGVVGYENEVHYDLERLGVDTGPGIVLIDKQAGAVWEIWETLQREEWRA